MTRAILLFCLLAFPALAGERIKGPATVRDADTIVVSGVPVRLNGVAAPELSEPLGREGKRAMQSIISGRAVTCDLTGERTYDRVVGVCYVDGVDIGAMIISLGLARDCPRYSGGRYAAVEANTDLPVPRYCR